MSLFQSSQNELLETIVMITPLEGDEAVDAAVERLSSGPYFSGQMHGTPLDETLNQRTLEINESQIRPALEAHLHGDAAVVVGALGAVLVHGAWDNVFDSWRKYAFRDFFKEEVGKDYLVLFPEVAALSTKGLLSSN